MQCAAIDYYMYLVIKSKRKRLLKLKKKLLASFIPIIWNCVNFYEVHGKIIINGNDVDSMSYLKYGVQKITDNNI